MARLVALLSCLSSCLAQNFTLSDLKVQRFTVTPPESLNVTEGGEAVLPCKVEHRRGQVQWVKDGLTLGYDRNITGYPRYVLVGVEADGEYNLKISSVILDDEGEFECQVLGPPILRASTNLYVDIRPSAIQMSALGQVKANEELEISCEVVGARPAADIVLKRAGADYAFTSSETEQTEEDNNLFNTTTKFKLIPRSSDNGISFSCCAQHPTLGPGQMEANRTMEVLYPPNSPLVTIRGHNLGDSLRSGQEISLQCESYGGNPLASLEWFRNGDKIDTTYVTHDQHKSVNVYTFTAAETDNKAEFRCEASNPFLSTGLSTSLQLTVLFPPSEVKITGPKAASINQTLKFVCESAKSNPFSTLQWVVDSKAFPASYEITEDSGSFSTKSEIELNITDYDRFKIVSCYAHNLALGERMWKTHKVIIEYPPDDLAISGWSETEVFLEGSVQKVKCTAMTGNPLPKLVWKVGGEDVGSQEEIVTKDEDGTEISISSEMTITMDRSDNGKTYKCKAKENKKKGKVLLSKDITFKVNFLPRTVDIEQPESLVEKMLANFTCTSQPSNPSVEIVWRYNNNILEAGQSKVKKSKKYNGFTTTSVLSMTLTDAHIDGKIKCEARHNFTDKSVFDSIDLDVKYSPKFTSVPGPMSAEEGDSIEMTVKAKANPAGIDFLWKRDNGVMVPGPQGSSHSRWSYNKVTPCPVQVPPLYILLQNVLTLTNLQRSDAGKWIVVANNSIDKSEASVEVSIQYPPSIVSLTDVFNSPVDPGGAVEIRCKVDANPLDNTVVKWEKVGSKFDYGSNTSFSNGESLLYLSNANESLSGNYSCVANNKVPKSSPKTVKMGTFVRVKHKPIFSTTGPTKVPCDKEKVDVPKCVLTCEARGTPDVVISWLRKGNNLKEDSKYSISSSSTSLIAVKSELELKTVKSEDFDNYTCVASNGLGDERQVVSLKVSGKPDPPVQLVATSATHNSITLLWHLDFTGGAKLEDIGYRIRQKKAGSESYVYRDVPKGKSEFVVDDLQSSTTYNFNILAFNTKGESDYTTDIVQKATTARPAELETPETKTPADPAPPGTSYSQLLIIISSVGGCLLLCNLALLYCYLRRRGSDTMSRSSILEMYFSSTSSQDHSQYTDSDSEESDPELEGRERVRRWRYDSPSPPPWSEYR